MDVQTIARYAGGMAIWRLKYTHGRLIEQEVLSKSDVRLSESLTSTGNGYMGMRGNFRRGFLRRYAHIGTYIGGVWFPDKTRVGWWKNGYPQYFGKSINAVRLMGIHVSIDGEAGGFELNAPSTATTIANWICKRALVAAYLYGEHSQRAT